MSRANEGPDSFGRAPKRAAPPPPRARRKRRRRDAGRALDGEREGRREVPSREQAPGEIRAPGDGQETEHRGWTMPWQRRPSWEYLPHLDEAPSLLHGDAERPGAQSKLGQPASSGWRASCTIDEADRTGNEETLLAHGARGEQHDAGKCDHGGTSATRRGGAIGAIQGRDSSPGATTVGVTEEGAPAASSNQIRGHDTVPGPNTDASESRAQMKLRVRNAHLARSLADHAERVAKRDMRGDRPTTATAAERISALRRRITARQGATAELPTQGPACGVHQGAARHAEQGAGNQWQSSGELHVQEYSNEESKMHHGEAVEEEGCRGAPSASTARGSAMAAAAATVAWHRRELPRDADGDHQLRAE